MDVLHLFEPEESVGKLWHRLVGDGTSVPRFASAAVNFDEVSARLPAFFRGLGGDPSVEVKAAIASASQHRLNWRMRLGAPSERIARASFDGLRFHLPHMLDLFPDRELNERLYYWLTAWTVAGAADLGDFPSDPVARDVARIAHAGRTTTRVLALFPGLAKHYDRLRVATLDLRPSRALPPVEARIESIIRRSLGSEQQLAGPDIGDGNLSWSAMRSYRTYLPVPLWGEFEPRGAGEQVTSSPDENAGASGEPGDERARRAKRRRSDQANKKGALVVYRFDKIISWTEFMNLHRDVEDDDEDNARKASDDHDEINIGDVGRKTSTRLKLDLDLAPHDVDAERLAAQFTYPEWDCRQRRYLADHARVLESCGASVPSQGDWKRSAKMERRIRAVRRQFSALRPQRQLVGRQLDGHELDMDALIRSHADLQARGQGSDRIFKQAREEARDLSVAVLIDASRSTESFVGDRSVIDIERETLIALAEGLHASGDDSGIFAFSSVRRDRVFVSMLKQFGEAPNALMRARIAALKPGFYTRLGAAVRHVSALLNQRPSRKRLLLILTDGKPNDLDHYEGQYGVEDSRRAIQEARRTGQAVFGITIDSKAQSYFPRLFGAGAFAIVRRASDLPAALPVLYSHLVK